MVLAPMLGLGMVLRRSREPEHRQGGVLIYTAVELVRDSKQVRRPREHLP